MATSAVQVASGYPAYTTIRVSWAAESVLHVELNRPNKLNSFIHKTWDDIYDCFKRAHKDADVRCVVISSTGRAFTAGLDLVEAFPPIDETDPPRRILLSQAHCQEWQDVMSSLENCGKPVICAINGACVGAGVDLITASNIRYATKDAYFCIKEIDIGLAADVGTLNRFPKIMGNQSVLHELAFTGRNLPADEAYQIGLVGKVFATKEEMIAAAIKTASIIAEKSPVAVYSTKNLLNFQRDHSVKDGLEYIKVWNTGGILEIPTALEAARKKQKAKYAKARL
ncbi:hypothetical protein SmJEL517_g02728 [Synchytrium microbalum]|uniref:Enoyl-CoA hydratase n=1 Tax=Synchytrium microbalum TaxID=1806994 RepID=A0A507C9K4_9FUNG|nr:uncharacterized protein SmJEL517_g02728 [Synchytrium microbalum]TPX34654.1 hypothetical protein SmJEL517_g02728 [Synchytrium microbalum]